MGFSVADDPQRQVGTAADLSQYKKNLFINPEIGEAMWGVNTFQEEVG